MTRSNVKPYGSVEQMIAQGLEQQPDIELLPRTISPEQLVCWMYHNLSYKCVAEHWRVIHGASEGSYMRDKVKEGLIEEHVYEGAGLAAIFYQRAWELIQYSFRDRIYPQLVRCKLDERIQTPFDFFGWLVVYEAHAGLSRCLKPLYTFRAREHAKLYRTAINALSEGKPLPKGPLGDPEPNPALCLMLTVCKAKAAKNNPLLEPTYRAFKRALIDLYDFQANHYWHASSYQWIGGRYGRGNKDGTYKRLT